jgi:transcriptional regulator with XRE-family HTH domain
MTRSELARRLVDTVPHLSRGDAETRPRSAPAANRHIGMRIRERRTMLGLNQRELGELVGVTNKQVQRYEAGTNGVFAGLLHEIARELSAPLDYFFEGLEQDERQLPLRQRMLLDVMRNLGEGHNQKYLEAISHLTRALAGR